MVTFLLQLVTAVIVALVTAAVLIGLGAVVREGYLQLRRIRPRHWGYEGAGLVATLLLLAVVMLSILTLGIAIGGAIFTQGA